MTSLTVSSPTALIVDANKISSSKPYSHPANVQAPTSASRKPLYKDPCSRDPETYRLDEGNNTSFLRGRLRTLRAESISLVEGFIVSDMTAGFELGTENREQSPVKRNRRSRTWIIHSYS